MFAHIRSFVFRFEFVWVTTATNENQQTCSSLHTRAGGALAIFNDGKECPANVSNLNRRAGSQQESLFYMLTVLRINGITFALVTTLPQNIAQSVINRRRFSNSVPRA